MVDQKHVSPAILTGDPEMCGPQPVVALRNVQKPVNGRAPTFE